jgi:hypothetical protein
MFERGIGSGSIIETSDRIIIGPRPNKENSGINLSMVHGLKMSLHILGSNAFEAGDGLSASQQRERRENGPLWAHHRDIPNSKVVTEILLGTPLEVTEIQGQNVLMNSNEERTDQSGSWCPGHLNGQ